MSKFDGVLGLSPKRAIKAVPKVVREAVPRPYSGQERRPRLPEDNRLPVQAATPGRQDRLSEGGPPARSERCRRAAACCLVEESSRLDVQPSKRSDIMQSHDAGVISVASLRPPPRPKKRSARRFPGRDFLKSK